MVLVMITAFLPLSTATPRPRLCRFPQGLKSCPGVAAIGVPAQLTICHDPFGAGFPGSVNSPSEIGTATLSIKVNTRNPRAKMPAATRNSLSVG